MMKKLAVIGIDALDPVLFERWRNDLPNLSRIAREGHYSRLVSVFPPDSVPSWTTIYTGLTPAEHGIIHSFNYLDKKKSDFSPDVGVFQGRTFWDLAGQAGRKVLILNPFMAYPSWQVNGTMVSGPVFEGGDLSAWPPDLLRENTFPPLGGIVDFPTRKQLPMFVENTRALTESQADCFLRFTAEKDWDLVFMAFLTFDRLAHFTWRYTDARDPTYPGETPLRNALYEAFQQYDRIIGRLLQLLPGDCGILILSDHGHTMRATRVFNINEFLRRRKYLRSRIDGIPLLNRHYWMEILKVKVLEFLDRHELQDFAFRIVKYIPNRKALKESTHVTRSEDSLAVSPDLDGTNPSGGIRISRARCLEMGFEFETFRKNLIAELSELRDPRTEDPLFRWICPREEIYASGKHLEEFPEILFELQPAYGVLWNLYGDLFGVNTTHRKISGGHRREGVLFTRGVPVQPDSSPPGVISITPTILDYLDVPIPSHLPGRSLLTPSATARSS